MASLAFFFFTSKVSAAVQMEEFANPRPQEEFIGPSCQACPCTRGLHIGKTHANKPLKLLVQDPGDFPLQKAGRPWTP